MKALLIILLIVLVIVVLAVVYPIITGRPSRGAPDPMMGLDPKKTQQQGKAVPLQQPTKQAPRELPEKET